MIPESAHYIAGGRTLAAINAWRAARKAHGTYMRALADELGCGTLMIRKQGTPHVCGFSIPDDGRLPPGFRRDPYDSNIILPKRSNREGKAQAIRWDAAPRVMSVADVMRLAGMRRDIFAPRLGGFPEIGWELIGDLFIVVATRLADGSTFGGDPYDSERIPWSRYWLMREEADAAQGVAETQ